MSVGCTAGIISTPVSLLTFFKQDSNLIAALPVDPLTNNGDPIDQSECAAAYDTGYTISQSATDNRITVNAPDAELGATISVTR